MTEKDGNINNRRKTQLTEEEIEVLKRVVERERALSWLSSSTKWIALWVVTIFGAWALLSKGIVDFIRSIAGS